MRRDPFKEAERRIDAMFPESRIFQGTEPEDRLPEDDSHWDIPEEERDVW